MRCRPGSFVNNSTGHICAACMAGSYSTGGATHCSSCPTGYSSGPGATSCTLTNVTIALIVAGVVLALLCLLLLARQWLLRRAEVKYRQSKTIKIEGGAIIRRVPGGGKHNELEVVRLGFSASDLVVKR